ncbi:MAG: ABC transporter ATP-binding protein [Candidatus Acetothermia bacterium]|jgi:putative ABC transport system ATP-binding protein|nr:ABC transporter ATP-binding protein [Candidatus Acetothermia bacterium]
MIEIRDVSKVYRKGRVEVPALRGVTLRVEEGEFLVIQGPSGSGKTTLLNLIGLLDEPSTGEIRLFGCDVQGLSDRERSRLRGRAIGFVFQSFNLIPHLRAWENVALPLHYAGVRPRERKRKALAVLEKMGLAGRAEHLPGELSGGEEQRVAIARAIVIEPKLILADEPTGNVDSTTGRGVMEEFARLNRAGITMIVATHDPMVVSFARRAVYLRDGQKADDGAFPLLASNRQGGGNRVREALSPDGPGE